MTTAANFTSEPTAIPSFQAQREYWNERWDRTPTPGPWSMRRAETILAWLRDLRIKDAHILDFGCGTGWFTAELANLGTAVGVDLSEAAIVAARRRYSKPTFIAANLFELEVMDRAFDVVVSQEVIAHVVDPVEYVDRLTWMLKPNGILVLTTANKAVMDRFVHPPDPPAHIKRWIGLDEIQTLLKPRYTILKRTTVVPRGDRGFLRFVNSEKVNALLRLVFSERQIERFKERAGWGWTLLILARRDDR